LTCLTKLVNNKFVIFDIANNTYKTYNPGKYTNPVPQEFNPEDYALLVTDRYSIVVDATARMRENYIVNKLWREQNSNNKQLKYRDISKSERRQYKIGDKVHLKDKDGIYTISDIIENNDIFGLGTTIRLTCNTWQHSDRPFRSFDLSCIKCLAGGLHNFG
jgi:hypothetical protein